MKPLDRETRLPQPVLARLDPGRLQAYLLATGWRLVPAVSVEQVAVYERPESRLEQARVPLTPQLDDFTRVLDLTVRSVAAWEDRPTLDAFHSLIHTPADIIHFVESVPHGPAVSFQHAVAFTTAIRDLLLSAIEECIPRRTRPAGRRTEGEQLLGRCRLDPFEADGFGVGIACPLEEGADEPLARRALLHLLRALGGAAQAPDNGELARPSERLREPLLRLRPEDSAGTLTVSVLWDRVRPPGQPLPDRVELGPAAFERLEAVGAPA